MTTTESNGTVKGWRVSNSTERGTALGPTFPGPNNAPDTGGCYTCRFAANRFGRPFCDVHKIVPSLPKDGCAGRERETGSDDEPFWRTS